MVPRALHPLNPELPIDSTAVPIITLFKAEQPSKADVPVGNHDAFQDLIIFERISHNSVDGIGNAIIDDDFRYCHIFIDSIAFDDTCGAVTCLIQNQIIDKKRTTFVVMICEKYCHGEVAL